MKFAWFPFISLLAFQTVGAFKDLFKPPPHDKPPSILDIITKPKIPSIHIQFGKQGSFGGGFGFGFGLGGGHFVSSGSGVNLPPKEHGKPEDKWDEKKDKVGPRPNWGEGKDKHPKPGSHDYDYTKPGSYDYDYPKSGGYEEGKEDYHHPESIKDGKDHSNPEDKDSLPDWEDIGEKVPKYDGFMDKDLIKEGLIQPRFNRRRSKRFVESRIIHVPLVFESNGKPYQVKISNHPNSLKKGNDKA